MKFLIKTPFQRIARLRNWLDMAQFNSQNVQSNFKSSDGTRFSVDRETTSLSAVWRGMLGNQENERSNGSPIQLSETGEELALFFKVLAGVFTWLPETSSDLEKLQPSQLISILNLAEKYQVGVVGVLVERQFLIDSISGLWAKKPLSTKERLLLFYYARQLKLKHLTDISAKLCLQIKDLGAEFPLGMDQFFCLRDHLEPLHDCELKQLSSFLLLFHLT